ncbi:MAG: hypothetical protein M1826_001721 [Phylliscum demangeonii]|nr:MAG: hypothetical protein M1826_001721 [Phylliscum demangeonii]
MPPEYRGAKAPSLPDLLDAMIHGGIDHTLVARAEPHGAKGWLVRFWMGYQEFRGIRGGMMVVMFKESPGYYNFKAPIGPPTSGYTKPFVAAFRAADLSGPCEICGGKVHKVTECRGLHPVILAPQDQIEVLLDQKPFIH